MTTQVAKTIVLCAPLGFQEMECLHANVQRRLDIRDHQSKPMEARLTVVTGRRAPCCESPPGIRGTAWAAGGGRTRRTARRAGRAPASPPVGGQDTPIWRGLFFCVFFGEGSKWKC